MPQLKRLLTRYRSHVHQPRHHRHLRRAAGRAQHHGPPVRASTTWEMDGGLLGLMLTVSAVCNLVVMMVCRPLTDRYGRKPFMMAALVL